VLCCSFNKRCTDGASWSPQIDQTFEVRGVGSVVAGTVVGGAIAVGQRLLLGPNAEAGFNPVIVTCIQRSSVGIGHREGIVTADVCRALLSCQVQLSALPHAS